MGDDHHVMCDCVMDEGATVDDDVFLGAAVVSGGFAVGSSGLLW